MEYLTLENIIELVFTMPFLLFIIRAFTGGILKWPDPENPNTSS